VIDLADKEKVYQCEAIPELSLGSFAAIMAVLMVFVWLIYVSREKILAWTGKIQKIVQYE
jgi:hypothetical protein